MTVQTAIATHDPRARRLLALGAVLFLFGLLTGFLLPALTSARIGLASHLEGVMNGTFLLVVGAIWDRVHLSEAWAGACFWLLVWGLIRQPRTGGVA